MPNKSLTDRLNGVREVTIREECSDRYGIPVGIVYRSLGTGIERVVHTDFPPDYVVTMRIRFRSPVSTSDLAASLCDYVKDEIPEATKFKPLSVNKAVYGVEGKTNLSFTVSPRDKSSRNHTSFVVRCNYDGAVDIFNDYARYVLNKRARIIKPKKSHKKR